MKIIVSIIIPIYRTEKFLRRCLNSIVSQTFQEFEAILIDDGSDDNCSSICDEYVNTYPTIFKVIHQENQGISNARNNGIKLSKGEFITFVDSDDYVSPFFLEDFIRTQRINDADLTICSYKKESILNTESFIFKQTYLKESEIYKLITEHNIIPQGYTWNKLYRKEIILKYNLSFEARVSLAEDAIFLFQYLTYTKKVELISNVNYYYQVLVRNDSLMNKKRSFFERFTLYHHYYESIIYLQKILSNEATIPIIGKHLSIMIDRQIQSIYMDSNTRKNRIDNLKKIDLNTYKIFRKGYTLTDKILVWLLVHRFYYIYDSLMLYITHNNE